MALDFSDITPEDLENDWDDVISTSIMLRAERDAANIDWDAIPSDQLVVGTEVLSYISKPRKAKRAKHQELQDVTNCAVFEASSSASRFGNTVTDSTSLATASKGFVPANTKLE